MKIFNILFVGIELLLLYLYFKYVFHIISRVMFKKTQFIICAILVLSSHSIFSQKLIKKAEMQIENGDYQLAVESYKEYVSENPTDYNTIASLATTYTSLGQLENALSWFESLPGDAILEPIAYKNHGDLLKKLGRMGEAMEKYIIYRNYNPLGAEASINSCAFAIKALSESPVYETFVMPCNSSTSDFGLTFYKDMPVFSSFREDILMTETEKALNDGHQGQKTLLYNQKKNRLGFVKAIDGKQNHIGPISFSANGHSCAIIESKVDDTYNFISNVKMSTLHIAAVNDRGEITSSKPFAYNEVGSSINAAQLAFDGTAIYFSSDRKGGFGGYDIYVSYLQNGNWSLPKNLGSEINTNGNEITPFFQGNELYFASDTHEGLGGFDILKSEVVNGTWTTPKNLGVGANSISDDYFPCFNKMGEMYFTSNRLGGKGHNDIYKTLKLKTEAPIIEEFADMPQAVSLEELASETQKHTINTEAATMVSLKEVETKVVSDKVENNTNTEVIREAAFNLPEFDTKKVGSNAFDNASLEGARRVAFDEIIPTTEVFFIQLASISSVKPNFNKYRSLIRYGNIYRMNSNRTVKVRLGYFTDRKEAEEVLVKVRANGYKDAFITFEILNTAQMELILSSNDEENFTDEGNFNSTNPSEEIRNFKVGGKYKVRLASYEDPIWFDINKVKDLGRIEQWTKGGWTIFILAGYNNLDEAKKAMFQANNRGFKTAEVVIDNGGILERMKQN